MSTVPARKATRNRLILHGVDWKTYTLFLRAFEERPGFRLTYDRGTLEIMAPLLVHDKDGDFLGVLVRTLTQELGLPVLGGGSVTIRRRKKFRGLEPDRCYWITNEPRLRGKKRLDLRVDPPPDLAIDVDVTRSSLDRMGIYAALGVPEVWRLDGPALTFHALGPSGDYAEQSTSPTFPRVTPGDLQRFLALCDTHDQNEVERQFRAWVRQRLTPQQPPAP
jgi:Uma2 family endonuclease